PALIMQGEPWMIIAVFIQAVIGIILFASAMQGYLMGVGRLGYGALQEIVIRALVLIAGLLLALPGGGMVPLSQWELIGLAAVALL
ncbi:MAG TPA: C4-dicarboxylate ABC transporter, partial [Halomonas sp.]|nr:C4-dicarboxylate ABC transporter [Halomonas sp.]